MALGTVSGQKSRSSEQVFDLHGLGTHLAARQLASSPEKRMVSGIAAILPK